ncbi:MAG TPA: cellulose binding domain-containing protein, partial [Pilimelia sp.]|nr:cellulose binding domain-containing protein [Pilimelia sp.]
MIARKWRIALVTAVTSMAATAGLTTTLVAHAAVGCQVAYSVQNQWQGGFGANVTVTNLGDPLTSWRLTWSFTAGQTITQLWNGSHTQSGSQVTVSNVSYNGNLPTNGSTSFGFNGASSASNPQPASFALNGVTCTGGTTGNPTGGPTAGPTSSSPRPPTPSASPTGGNTGGGTGTTCNTAPVNPNATPAARRLLCLVVNTYGRGILSGQQESTWIGGPEYEMNHIQNTTGKLPAIRGLDMGDSPNFGSRAVAWWNAGGIPMVGYHMGSPSNSA